MREYVPTGSLPPGLVPVQTLTTARVTNMVASMMSPVSGGGSDEAVGVGGYPIGVGEGAGGRGVCFEGFEAERVALAVVLSVFVVVGHGGMVSGWAMRSRDPEIRRSLTQRRKGAEPGMVKNGAPVKNHPARRIRFGLCELCAFA